ncbi:MAG: hypothetical protein HZB16_04630 [Armatimonadetes bacterium]|nr:hypothetical protein [Armatimonadota bacterium]
MLDNVTLELSLKPFWEPDIDAVCRRLFAQWKPLTDRARMVSVMLWTADGSEILDYRGTLDAPLEWARYIGGANPRHPMAGDPEGVCLHSRAYLYRPDPPEFSYRSLADIVAALRRVGQEVADRPIRVGATFDPGPEFALSPFKYERHNEICLAGTMGRTSFVCCYGRLRGDDVAYAGFPQGIPEDTPLGTFLGRQSQHFLRDLGFDYLWLSNGFGFGMETWATTGAVFDGERFDASGVAALRAKQLEFWRLFRAECPEYPLETRGTNLTTGIDLASDAVPLAEIYRGDFGLMPPPNSPWAALNGDFGFELAGYLSHIAELPDSRFPFRFYIHDPWWLNSPWLDRYGREPHDIYLPLSVARVDGEGRVRRPSSVALLTADDSYGAMPDQVPREVIPHLSSALDHAPDEPGPLVWVYPFDEYHAQTFDGDGSRLREVFFGDWLIRSAINEGLPLNSVISTTNWLACAEQPQWRSRVFVTPVPDAGTPLSQALLAHVQAGGRLLLYGTTRHADPAWRDLLGIELSEPVDGPMTMVLQRQIDDVAEGAVATAVTHNALLSGGPVAEAPADDGSHLAILETHAGPRVAASVRGTLAWVRGADTQFLHRGAHLVGRHPASEAYPGGALLRVAVERLGYHISFDQVSADQRVPLTCMALCRGGWFLSGYVPDTTVGLRLRLPQGAPLLIGAEARLVDGRAVYHLPRAWHRECRVFVEQASGVVSCVEQHSGEIGIRRRLLVGGLRDALLRFYPEPGTAEQVTFLREPRYPYVQNERITPRAEDGCLVVRGVSGQVLISW